MEISKFNVENLKKYENEVKSLNIEDNLKAEDVKKMYPMEDNLKNLNDDSFKNFTRVVINNSGTGNVLFNKTLFQDDKKINDDSSFMSNSIDYKPTKTGVILNLMMLFGLFFNF